MDNITEKLLVIIKAYPKGVNLKSIEDKLDVQISRRALQYKLSDLIRIGIIENQGRGRGSYYYYKGNTQDIFSGIPIKKSALNAYKYIQQDINKRKPVGYNQKFLDEYIPNETSYLSKKDLEFLSGINTSHSYLQDADTYTQNIVDRLLIDLSWNSSRLEGNTYSLLDTKRLIEFGEKASGHSLLEAQMILNHKEAISFIIRNDGDIGMNRYTMLNLHALLSQNLLPDPSATGRLRHIPVAIESSTFIPLEAPQRIEQCFDIIIDKANMITDPFETAFFLMVHIPYLQPFDDVNKRMSRVIANMPLFKRNLSPLSFTDVPKEAYIAAILCVYELNNISLLKDLFLWAYERSSQKYAAIKQSISEPNPFRVKYYQEMRHIIAKIIASEINRSNVVDFIQNWSDQNIDKKDFEKFQVLIENELLSLHEGNFARYHVTPSQFKNWKNLWGAG